MDGFIPPPFPFPEVWPRVFAEQQQRQRWLTPATFTPVPCPVAEYYHYAVGQPISAQVETATVDAREEDGEYEYGYVLSDEWRDRFQSSVQLQQPQPKRSKSKKKKKTQLKKTKPQQRQVANAEAVAAASASRSGHLQREIQAAKTRELARKWKRQGGTTATSDPQVTALETSLNMLFDEFCDAFQPVVWPHDPLQR